MQLRALTAAAVLMLAADAVAQNPATLVPEGAPAQQGLVAPGRSPDLEILFTGDVVGYLEPCG